MPFRWSYAIDNLDWNELAALYEAAPLGNKNAKDLKTVFNHSMFKCFVYDNDNKLIGAGRALADGADCSYICDIAIHPICQGLGLGKKIVGKLVELSNNSGHKKIILYSVPGKESFYQKLGFKRMNTAMAIFANQPFAIESGYINNQ